MWVVHGEFDANGANTKKLLKPGKTYKIGRKAPADLIIASKSISQGVFAIVVGPFTAEQVQDFSSRPSLEFVNEHASKDIAVNRGGGAATEDGMLEEDEANSYQVRQDGGRLSLEDGDRIALTSSIFISVKWHPSEFSSGAKVSVTEIETRIQQCTLMGCHLRLPSKEWQPGASHLIVPQIRLIPVVMMALAHGAHIVSLDYFNDLYIQGVERSATERGSLENSFDPPEPLDMLPQLPDGFSFFDQEEAPGILKSQPERRKLLVGTTCLFIHASDEPSSSLSSRKELVEVCGGRVLVFSLSSFDFSSEVQAQRELSKHKANALSWCSSVTDGAPNAPDGGLVVLVQDALQYHDEPWYRNLVSATRAAEIRMPDNGLDAVVTAILYSNPRQHLNATASISVSQIPAASHQLIDPSVATGGTGAQGVVAHAQAPTPSDPAQAAAPASGLSPPIPTTATAGSSAPAGLSNASAPVQTPQFDPSALQQQQQQQQQQSGLPPEDSAGSMPPPVSARPRRRAGLAKPVNALDQLFAEPSGSNRSQADPPTAPVGSSQVGPTTQDSAPGASAATQSAASSSTVPQRRRRAGGQSRISDVFGGSSSAGGSAGGVGGTQDAEGDDNFRKSKRFRHMLDEEDGVVPSQTGAKANRGAGSGSGSPEGQDSALSQSATTRGGDIEMQAADNEGAVVGSESSSRSRENARASKQPEKQVAESPASKTQSKSHPTTTQVIRSTPGPRGKGVGEKPDEEPTFLQALAMRKKGKKAVIDDFDREFNNLKLTKPARGVDEDRGRDEAYEAWEATRIDDWETPVGNFVQVDFVPLMRKDGRARGGSAAASVDAPSKWANLPNFKKFKPKGKAGSAPPQEKQRRAPVRMDLTEGQDFGLGEDYMDRPKAKAFGLAELEPEDDDTLRTHAGMGSQARRVAKSSAMQRSQGVFTALQESDDEETQEDRGGRRAGPSQRGAAAKGMQSRRRSTLEEDDNEEEEDDDGEAYPDLRLPTNTGDYDMSISRSQRPPTSRNKRGKTATQLRIDGDDSEDDAGGGARGPGSKRTHSRAAGGDDDSDSDGGFKGFGGASKSRSATAAKRARFARN
ncbi:hypothetical protein BDZ90DRAFT_229801 [Jaminaea rosea]|uniref:Uncharacterized protein n=1 Tax=Jaminaea rosea TaxID=1569628 RepID=A0A316V5U9_9BASI|nr:hypothetical protein BDZ90DRAFT_229801 [Jaminaea rosea]PWN30805.1 hypothetical protein BDZ90DRAFT_229801 [Jaminaea rosea]